MLFNNYICQVKFQTLMHIIIIWKICLNQISFIWPKFDLICLGDGPVIYDIYVSGMMMLLLVKGLHIARNTLLLL